MPVMHSVYQLLLLTFPQVHQDPPHQKNLIRDWGMPLQICYATRADDPVQGLCGREESSQSRCKHEQMLDQSSGDFFNSFSHNKPAQEQSHRKEAQL